MKRKKRNVKLDFDDLAKYRRSVGENQGDFWRRFGVTQSGGSRYENGRSVPRPVRILMSLYAAGVLSEDDLALAAGGKVRRQGRTAAP